jgi:hypothetical protein
VSRIQDIERLADAERDMSALVTAVLAGDDAGFAAVADNSDWRMLAEVGATWLARVIVMLSGDGMCINCTRRGLLAELRQFTADVPEGPDSVST